MMPNENIYVDTKGEPQFTEQGEKTASKNLKKELNVQVSKAKTGLKQEMHGIKTGSKKEFSEGRRKRTTALMGIKKIRLTAAKLRIRI
jgi:hypothetical protein